MTFIKEYVGNRENECNEIPIFRNKKAVETFKINKDWKRPPENLSCRLEKVKKKKHKKNYKTDSL